MIGIKLGAAKPLFLKKAGKALGFSCRFRYSKDVMRRSTVSLRSIWCFDARTFIEKLDNSGWSAYEYLGDMALYCGFSGQPARLYHPSNYNLHGHRGELKKFIKQALFGVSRPTQAD